MLDHVVWLSTDVSTSLRLLVIQIYCTVDLFFSRSIGLLPTGTRHIEAGARHAPSMRSMFTNSVSWAVHEGAYT